VVPGPLTPKKQTQLSYFCRVPSYGRHLGLICESDSEFIKTITNACNVCLGSSTSGILAILFMDKLEQIALSSHRFISPYKRYVDDIYLQTANEEKANEFHDTMNGLHPRLKFEIEKPTASPEGLSLSLLDFKLTITTNGESSFEFYKKPAKKPLFVHHQSALPKVFKDQFHPQRTEAYTTEMFNPNNVQQTRPRPQQHSPPQRISRTHHK